MAIATKPRFYAHAFGSRHDGSYQAFVMDRETGIPHALASDIIVAEAEADHLNDTSARA